MLFRSPTEAGPGFALEPGHPVYLRISFEDAEVDKERGVVISEWRSNLSPDQRHRRQRLFRVAQPSAHQLIMPQYDHEIAAMAVELELLAAGDLRGAEQFAGDHGFSRSLKVAAITSGWACRHSSSSDGR